MKLGITLIIWALGTTWLCGTAFGITIIAWSDVDIWVKAGFWTGFWLVIGGLPLYFGIRKAKREKPTD